MDDLGQTQCNEPSSILFSGSDLLPLFSASFLLFFSVLNSDIISFTNSLPGYILYFCDLI